MKQIPPKVGNLCFRNYRRKLSKEGECASVRRNTRLSGAVQADFALWRLVYRGKSPDGRAAARRDSEFRGLSPLGPSGCIDWEIWAAALPAPTSRRPAGSLSPTWPAGPGPVGRRPCASQAGKCLKCALLRSPTKWGPQRNSVMLGRKRVNVFRLRGITLCERPLKREGPRGWGSRPLEEAPKRARQGSGKMPGSGRGDFLLLPAGRLARQTPASCASV